MKFHFAIGLQVSCCPTSQVAYNTSVWFYLNVMDKLHVKKVQRWASRIIPYQHLYKEQLSRLGIPSLHFRQDYGDLINLFCIIKGINNLDFDSFFKYSHYHTTYQHHYKLYPPKSNKKIGQCTFSSRVVSDWNSLPV